MIDLGAGRTLSGLGKFNAILGKNGSGKSTLLRTLEQKLNQSNGCVRYITPERGGTLTYDGAIDTNQASNPSWVSDRRRTNRWEGFRSSSVTELRTLETLALRSIEANPEVRASAFRFDQEIDRINSVLDRVIMRRSEKPTISLVDKETGAVANVQDLSSGESELISLAIEILSFAYLCKLEKFAETENWLLLDEPDVHLHPDLQYRLMKLLSDSIAGTNGKVLISTHSTSIVSGLYNQQPDMRIGLSGKRNSSIVFSPVNDALSSLVPVFGAHPLSNIFNENPPLIVEGEDDERIWQSAVRSSGGIIKLFPCVAGSIVRINEYEVSAADLIESIYESANAYSLRDRDDVDDAIDDLGPVVRMRLNCRSAENLILTDDVLAELGTDWEALKKNLEDFLGSSPTHSRYASVLALKDSGWNRRDTDIKDIRNLITGLSGSNKPWEVAVGQAIAKMSRGRFKGEFSLEDFLGAKTVESLNLIGK